MKLLVSVIVICKELTELFLQETVPAVQQQSYPHWELLILPDKKTEDEINKAKIIPTWPKTGPADKKDLGLRRAQGEIVAFIDDDAYPDRDWLKSALGFFADEQVAAVCGPGLTPPADPLLAQVSGWFWSSYLGSGAAGTYRCWPDKQRYVDDYPTFNLVARKKDLLKVKGFDSAYWPGEDTKLCHDLVYQLGKKIVYHPSVLVYHHRRPILTAHLKQLGRYGLHRGYFVKVLPRTSRRVGYFLPALFFLGVVGGPLLIVILALLGLSSLALLLASLYLLSLSIYLAMSVISGFWVLLKSKSLLVSLLLVPTFFISHVFYGLMFVRGLTAKVVRSKYTRERI